MAEVAVQPSASIDIPYTRGRHGKIGSVSKHGAGLPTPPSSISPLMPAHHANHLKSPPLLNIVEEDGEATAGHPATPPQESASASHALSMDALMGLDNRAAITPSLLARDYLPNIMLGNGPQPIRHLMGELTHTLPGFSRIPPAKARRLVVAALEGRGDGGRNADISFCKVGWGRWDAFKKGEQPGNLTVYAQSFRSSSMQDAPDQTAAHRSLWPQAEYDIDDVEMDGVVEQDADNMSLDDVVFSASADDDDNDDDDGSDTTDDDDWAAVGALALRKASLPAPGQPAPPRTNYQALGVPICRPSRNSLDRRFSTVSDRSIHSAMVSSYSPQLGPMHGEAQTPEEKVAIEALLRMGSL